MLDRIAFVVIWLFVFSIPSEKTLEIDGIGTVTKLLGLAALPIGLLGLIERGRLRIPGLAHGLLACFTLWSALSVRWTLDMESTQRQVGTFVQLLVLVWLIWEYCGTEDRVKALMGAYVAGVVVPVADTISRFMAGKSTFYNRFATEGFDPNDLALTLALSLPLAYALSISASPAVAWLCRLQIPAALGTVMLTASRGGTLACLVGLSLVIFTWRQQSRRYKTLLTVMAAVVIVAILAVTPPASLARLATLGSEVSQGTLNSRTVLWRAGWEAYAKVPFTGVGTGAYPETTVEWMGRPTGWVPVAHNTFLSVLVETGLIGFSFFAALLICLVVTAKRMRGNAGKMWLVMMATWGIGVFSLTWEHRKPTWLMFALLPAHAAALTARKRGAEADAASSRLAAPEWRIA